MNYREEFSALGEMLVATVRYARDRSAQDRRLEMQAVSGMGSVSGNGGGFLIPDELSSEIWQRVDASGQILSRCTKQPVTRKFGDLRLPSINEASRTDGSRYGGLRLAWLDQGESFPESKPLLGQIKFSPKKLGGVLTATDELVEDLPALDAWFSRITARELAFDTEDAIINGDGVGRPLGILQSGALIIAEKDSDQDPATLTAANLRSMVQRLWPASIPTAVWLLGPDVYAAIIDLNDTDGGLLGRDSEGNRTLLDFPICFTESTSKFGELGDLILADLGEYLVCEREAGTNILSDIHIRFATDETSFRVVTRVDGAPAWSTPVTIKNASKTVSPFVTLEARS